MFKIDRRHNPLRLLLPCGHRPRQQSFVLRRCERPSQFVYLIVLYLIAVGYWRAGQTILWFYETARWPQQIGAPTTIVLSRVLTELPRHVCGRVFWRFEHIPRHIVCSGNAVCYFRSSIVSLIPSAYRRNIKALNNVLGLVDKTRQERADVRHIHTLCFFLFTSV